MAWVNVETVLPKNLLIVLVRWQLFQEENNWNIDEAFLNPHEGWCFKDGNKLEGYVSDWTPRPLDPQR